MTLKSDLRNIFINGAKNKNTIEKTAELITNVYEDAVINGRDSIGNNWENINYDILQDAIIAQYKLAFDTNSYLRFSLIETGLISAWTTATLIIPAIPQQSMSIVNTGKVVSSSLVNTTPLIQTTLGYDNIVNKYYDTFVNHAETLKFLYIGISNAATPAPITVSVSSYEIK